MYTLDGTVWYLFSQVLAVSGQKTLAISNRYIQIIKSQPYIHGSQGFIVENNPEEPLASGLFSTKKNRPRDCFQ